MIKYVAFLRGIAPLNPNMKNEKLRGVFEDLGFQNVRSVISSGNILFESDETDVAAMEATLEAAWPKRLGFNSTTIIRSQAELQKLANRKPFKDAEHSPKNYLLVTFFKHQTKIKFTFPYQPPGREYHLIGKADRALFSIIDTTGAKTPDLMSWLDRQFGKEISSRTWKTVQLILKKLDA